MRSDNRDVLSNALGCDPDFEISSAEAGWSLCRWRTLIGVCEVAELPDPLMSIHISGQRQVRVWEEQNWSNNFSTPGNFSMFNTNMSTKWLINGELDVITISIDNKFFEKKTLDEKFRKKNIKFSLEDNLSISAAREMIDCIYNNESNDKEYIYSIMNMMKHHIINKIIPNLNNEKLIQSKRIPYCGTFGTRLHKVIHNIRKNPSSNYSLDNLAIELNVSKSSVINIFKKSFNTTPYKFILTCRLEKSKYLLKTSDSLVSQIAYISGFESHEHFTRSFKKYYGISPTSYRNNCRIQN